MLKMSCFDNLQLRRKKLKLLGYFLRLQSCIFYDNINNLREYYAISKIQALVRGFLDRIFCNKLHREAFAIKTMQRLLRGKLGRIRWMIEYWKSLSIVKSSQALQVNQLQAAKSSILTDDSITGYVG